MKAGRSGEIELLMHRPGKLTFIIEDSRHFRTCVVLTPAVAVRLGLRLIRWALKARA